MKLFFGDLIFEKTPFDGEHESKRHKTGILLRAIRTLSEINIWKKTDCS